MREINECKAEVFRRSENRIKERRKRRNRILALSTPLCLCVVLGIIVLSPSKKTADLADPESAGVLESTEDMDGTKGDSDGAVYSMVEIEKNNVSVPQYVKETDMVGVNHILESLESSFREPGEQDNMGAQNETIDTDGNYSMALPDLTITFSNAAGGQMVYLMYGNGLSNVTTNESVLLTEEQQSELMKEIDMMIDGEEAFK